MPAVVPVAGPAPRLPVQAVVVWLVFVERVVVEPVGGPVAAAADVVVVVVAAAAAVAVVVVEAESAACGCTASELR